MNREQLLEKYTEQIDVGPHGFVRLVDVMGDDAAIVQAARVSYGAGTKTVKDDRALIRYLMRHRHTSPIEMCEIKLHIKAPIHVFRQLVRHRTASLNEVSTRYSEVRDEFEILLPEDFRLQSVTNKQGSDGQLDEDLAEEASGLMRRATQMSYEVYRDLIALRVPREQARNVLPLSTYSEMYWKIDLKNLLHCVGLRSEAHAQKEIRDFSNAMALIVQDWVPDTYEAFLDYHVYAQTFSRREMEAVRAKLAGSTSTIEELLESSGITSAGEKREFYEKIAGVDKFPEIPS